MPITSVSKDPAALTMTVVADFPVPVQRLWDAYADPRQLELFWGPPTYPARFTRHDMYPGGRSECVMTGRPLGVPGRSAAGVLRGPRRVRQPGGAANIEMPAMRMMFRLAETDTGSQVSTLRVLNGCFATPIFTRRS